MISVVMPAYNEEATLEASVAEVVSGLRGARREFEVVVVENGSTDGTPRAAEGLAGRLPEVRVVSLPRADYGAALRAGFLAARGDVVVNFDVDYFDLEFLADAVLVLQGPPSSGGRAPAIVVGSKRTRGSVDRRAWSRRLVTWAFSVALRMLFGLRVSDTHGMKALARERLVPVVERCRFASDLFDTELLLRAERAGIGIAEVPVDVRERRPSRTNIARRIPRSLAGLARLRVALSRERSRGSWPL